MERSNCISRITVVMLPMLIKHKQIFWHKIVKLETQEGSLILARTIKCFQNKYKENTISIHVTDFTRRKDVRFRLFSNLAA